MTSRKAFRWMPFGLPFVFHLDSEWLPARPGGEARHEPMCGTLKGPVEIDPDGRIFCLRCRQMMLANYQERP